MAKEVRCILFSSEEVLSAVSEFLTRKVQGLDPYEVKGVELIEAGSVVCVRASYASQKGALELDGNELMAAVLMFCRRVRIPLSNRSAKKLELANGSLVLAMSMNLEFAAPSLEQGTVMYTSEADRAFARSRVPGDQAASQ